MAMGLQVNNYSLFNYQLLEQMLEQKLSKKKNVMRLIFKMTETGSFLHLTYLSK